ncbi:MAG TPA: PAS domain S-box protein, partial [Bacteroidia bacterium]|nr:PAS domain S-box protein [Bacteroidia bacterium]
MENALKAPLYFYKTLFDIESEMGVGIAITQDEKLIFVNNALCNMYGYNFEEFRQMRSFFDLIPDEEKQKLTQRLREHTSGDRVHGTGETKIRCKDGRIIDVEYITRNFLVNGVLNMLTIAHDITEKKNTERKTLYTEWLLKEAQELSKIGNWNVDFLTNEAFWSEGLRVIRGVDKDVVADFDGFINMIHPDDREQTVAKIMKAREASTATEMEYRFIRGDDGAERIFRDTINVERDSNGKLKRLFGFSQDITEQRIAEREIEHLNTLIYQMSHDIRGPLNSAKNLLYISQGKVKDKK